MVQTSTKRENREQKNTTEKKNSSEKTSPENDKTTQKEKVNRIKEWHKLADYLVACGVKRRVDFFIIA